MRLYLQYLKILLKSALQYRVSFILLSIGQFFVPFSIFISMYFLFQRFEQIKGWTLYEVALCYAVIHIAFSLSECFFRGFDSFSSLIISGEFDRILVRPRSALIQILGSRFEFTRIGRLFQSFIVLVYAVYHLNLDWNYLKIITLIAMILSGVVIFGGIFILGATLTFWTIEGLEVINILTDGGREISQYPLNIYPNWVKNFLTFVIPFGTINYLPLLYVLDKTNKNNLYAFIPFIGMLFLIPCLLFWKLGIKHYKSTGS